MQNEECRMQNEASPNMNTATHPAPAPIHHSSFILHLSPRAALVTVDTACTVLGVDSETLTSMVEDGSLVWVWDLSARQNCIRSLRFWTGELMDRSAARKPRAEVISAIIPASRDRFRTSELAQALRISDPHLLRLVQCGHLVGTIEGHTRWITRKSAAAFLESRLVM